MSETVAATLKMRKWGELPTEAAEKLTLAQSDADLDSVFWERVWEEVDSPATEMMMFYGKSAPRSVDLLQLSATRGK